MKKKYQVFVSSTYEDLKDERAAVMQCLLDNDCIPVGMEQFPASEMSQMEYIKKMLDDCDYYVLISAGRYGSLDTDGIGFTEKEYDYAISKSIPVMSILHSDIDNLPIKKCEATDAGKEKLVAFRQKISTGRMVKFYNDIGSLKYCVINAINHCIRHYPAVGWVRGDFISTKESNISNDEQQGLKLLAQMVKRRPDGSISFTLPKETIKEEVNKVLDERTLTNEEIEELLNKAMNDDESKYSIAINEDIDERFSSDVITLDGGTAEGHSVEKIGNAVVATMKNLAGGNTVIIGEESSVTEQIIKEHDKEIEKALSEI